MLNLKPVDHPSVVRPEKITFKTTNFDENKFVLVHEKLDLKAFQCYSNIYNGEERELD